MNTTRMWLMLVALALAIPSALADDALERRIDRQLKALDQPDANRRRMAATILGSIGAPAKRAAESLQLTATDKEPPVREAAALALGKIGADDPASIKILSNLSDDGSADVRVAALRSLSALGAKARSALIPIGVERLRDVDEAVRIEAVDALRACGQPAVAPLVEALADGKNKIVRRGAARALEGMGDAAVPAIDALAAALDDKDSYVRLYAGRALGEIGSPAVAKLAAALDDDGPKRQLVLEVLGTVGPAAKAAVPKLIGLTDPKKHKDAKLRTAAIFALGRMGAPSKETIAALSRALGDPEPGVRGQACAAVGGLGKPGLELMPRLRALFDGDKDDLVVDFAAEAMHDLARSSGDEKLQKRIRDLIQNKRR